ncbi:hypothetical protein Pst134EB_010492 [Puccinia striiformis f. sp. tritici]|nr:hypothetical protein Pst134EB_010492 [Puccinia striiformis f. sp. tritici]
MGKIENTLLNNFCQAANLQSLLESEHQLPPALRPCIPELLALKKTDEDHHSPGETSSTSNVETSNRIQQPVATLAKPDRTCPTILNPLLFE